MPSSATTSRERNLPRLPPPDDPRAPSFNDECSGLFADCSEGANPKMIPVSTHKANEKAKTPALTRASAMRGKVPGFNDRTRGSSEDERKMPRAQPASDSSRLSI